MYHNTCSLAPIAGLALMMALAPAPPARGQACSPVATPLALPVQGVVTNPPPGCRAVTLNGQLFALVQAWPPDPCFPGAPGEWLVQVSLAGILSGTTPSGQPVLAAVAPVQTPPMICHPPDPCCAAISSQVSLFAIGPIAALPNPGQIPPDPCSQQTLAGTLCLTLNTDGTLQSAQFFQSVLQSILAQP